MRKSKDGYFMDMLTLVAARSTCARRAVGAIITDVRGVVLGMGYNGTPRATVHCTESPCPGAADKAGDSSRCYAIHAEQNALLQCSQLHLAYTLYVTVSPCFTCTKLIMQTEIERIIFEQPYPDRQGLGMLMTRLLYRYHADTDTIHRISA